MSRKYVNTKSVDSSQSAQAEMGRYFLQMYYTTISQTMIQLYMFVSWNNTTQ